MARDFYSILRVPRTASLKEIKSSYRKLALRFHPDVHTGDPEKTAEFRRVSEAYAILSDTDKKNSYDFKIGVRYNKNRRTAPPPNYRSVKFPDPPPDWKMVWDHKLHHDMHYGDGMYENIIRKAKRQMKKEGTLEYRSPLGEGFTFSRDDPKTNQNPYSKSTAQGPPTIEFIFEEFNGSLGDLASQVSNQDKVRRQVRVVENLHGRREQRREYQSARKKQEEKANCQNSAFTPKDGTCVIL
eukprot:CAMPEP_0198146524 /NCGR_PEP_ID=MMETSP1443-20131203/29704_1 /TAXON_ID=186043 /ORGANISM="Entomoneis sp., Strain CCMP2396" /LENGTH=240 /DNA_ID=CAMNT_0043810513 /DNA_START=157 /DNA_END=879 /DNA_ORIENTATION=+